MAFGYRNRRKSTRPWYRRRAGTTAKRVLRWYKKRQVTRNPTQKTIYKFMVTHTDETNFRFTGTSIVDDMGIYSFILDDLPNVAEYKALFDVYRIYKIEMFFTPKGVNVLTNQTATNMGEWPVFGMVTDYDDSNTPANLNEIRQYNNYKEFRLNSSFRYVVYPRTASVLYDNAVTVAYGQSSRKQWIDCAYSAVPHYGVKFGVSPYTLNNGLVIGFNVRMRYHVLFRETR